MLKYVFALSCLCAVGCGAEEACDAPPEWFIEHPAEPSYSEPPAGNECEFYKLAWQTLLYLIQSDASGDPIFLSYKSPAELFGGESSPRFAAADSLAKTKTKGPKLLLAPRLSKTQSPSQLGSILQAKSHSVLVDHSGRAVYYAQHVNPAFENFALSLIEVKDAAGKVIGHDPQLLANVPATTFFPKGCVELKSSWKIATDQEKADPTFYKTQAWVEPLMQLPDGTLTIDTNLDHLRNETVALVGIHVVIAAEKHPEFIWSTFEHVNNAPGFKPGANLTDPVDNTGKPFTFYTSGTPASKCNLRNDSLATNQDRVAFRDAGDAGFQNQILVIKNPNDPAAPTVTQVCRVFPFGSGDKTCGDDPKDFDGAVKAINKSVKDKMIDGRFTAWQNYQLRGAVWLNDPTRDFNLGADNKGRNFAVDDDTMIANLPKINGFPQCLDEKNKGAYILLGERRLSNATMETFTQGKYTQLNAGNSSCFGCHTTLKENPVKPDGTDDPSITMKPGLINVSHIMVNGLIYQAQNNVLKAKKTK